MNQAAIRETLIQLAQIDIDAIRAYTQAIHNCSDTELTRILAGFREDHDRHVLELSHAIRMLGGRPPQNADLSGFAIAGFTTIAANTGRIGTLMAMESNEIVTNDAYDRALFVDMDPQWRDLVERNAADEQRHLETLRQLLETNPAGRLLSQAAATQGAATAVWTNVLRHTLPAALIGAGTAWFLDNLGRSGGNSQNRPKR